MSINCFDLHVLRREIQTVSKRPLIAPESASGALRREVSWQIRALRGPSGGKQRANSLRSSNFESPESIRSNATLVLLEAAKLK